MSTRKSVSPWLQQCTLHLIFCVSLAVVVGRQEAVAQTQPVNAQTIESLIAALKSDPRGPFQGIRWFCPDGSVISPQERCEKPGGIQHGLLKDAVARLQQSNHLYIGQVLAGTDFEAFADTSRFFSRLKQYQLERYLAAVDDGWIFRRAQFYRGAYQAEDEEAWGRRFLEWLLASDDRVASRFFLLREAVRDIPHQASRNTVQRIRALSMEIADGYRPFMELRVKIHGQPEASDTLRVAAFSREHLARMPAPLRQKLAELQATMTSYYGRDLDQALRESAGLMPPGSPTARRILALAPARASGIERSRELASILYGIRAEILQQQSRSYRLALLDLSIACEQALLRHITAWTPATSREEAGRTLLLAEAAAGAGLLERWEWDDLRPLIDPSPDPRQITLERYLTIAEAAARAVDWGIGMLAASYEDVIDIFGAFEPRAAGFLDDRARSSVLLALGESAGAMSARTGRLTGRPNDVMGLAQSGGSRALNPGVAMGRLVVVTGSPEAVAVQNDAIYVMTRPPAELKPVAGIATVSEGNLVSHVQLLARNLGIPNAVFTPELVRALESYSGQRVFFAVSPGGVVLMKPAEAVTDEERTLIESRARSEERIRVPIDRLDLDDTSLTSLYDLRAADSGRLCGPKAANLGQLSSLFPGRVAPGFIIPFGIFRRHMDQRMPNSQETYWEHLRSIFRAANRMREQRESESRVEAYVLEQLQLFREEIERIPLEASFVEAVRARFMELFGTPLGEVPVFIRSDTNMEDLKDFTGAGLNLTVPNVVDEKTFLQGIRRVWASPYRERGYQWRQRYLVNPEDVYPSLLVLQSVNVEKSGVLITTGVASGRTDEVTVAFNRGVGGAVDGQVAETYALGHDGDVLLSPAREAWYTTLPKTGGTQKALTSFETPILLPADREALRATAADIRSLLPGTPGIESSGPFDVELGVLNGEIVLFQARPFVENRAANSSRYLLSLEPPIDERVVVDMDAPIR